jgi:hypothetical protein
MVAVRFVDETNVVRRGVPFHSTALPGMKPLPATDRVKSPPVAGTDVGERDIAIGSGFKLVAFATLLVNRRTPASAGSEGPT